MVTMGKGLRNKTIQNLLYILVGSGLDQLVRLASNLILTRLLVPELFGLMAIVGVATAALTLFSDIGTGTSVIQNPRGLEPDFLNTAWTLQVIRGGALSLLTVLLAYPTAYFYDQPLLANILPVAGLGLLVSGFQSMATVKMERNLQAGKVIKMNSIIYLISTIFTLLLAYFYRNIWSLVIGNLSFPILQTYWSYKLDLGLRHRFQLERSIRRELFHYGKWIFLSTGMMFLSTQTDKILLAKFFPIATFGIYNIAITLSGVPKSIVDSISNKIIFPLISLNKSLQIPILQKKILDKRRWMLVGLAVAVSLFIGFADCLIKILFDPRYYEAGWMLSILALGMWPLILYATVDRCLYVLENPKYPAFGNALKFIYMLVLLPLAYKFLGIFGAVLVVALNDLPPYLVVHYGLKRKQFSCLAQDAWTTAILIVLLASILLARHFAGLGMPWQVAFSSGN